MAIDVVNKPRQAVEDEKQLIRNSSRELVAAAE